MIILFRILILVAIASLLAAACLPFDRPFQISVDLNQPPPAWLALSGAFVIAVLGAVVASGALFLFRGWGRWLGALACVAGLVIAWLAAGSPIARSVSTLATTLLVLSAFTWLTVLVLSCHPSVMVRFRHER